MITTKVAYLNKSILIEESEPSTIQELTALIGEDEVVQMAVKNLRYRNKYPRVYRRVSIEVAKQGFEPKLIRTTSEGKKIFQDEFDHLSSFATAAPENMGVLRALFERIATEEPLQSPGDRISGGGRISQGALDAAHRYFAAGPEEVERVVSKIEQTVTYKVARNDEDITPELLARGIQVLNRWAIQQAKLVTQNL